MDYYVIFDTHAPLLADLPEVEAPNGKEAVLAYLKTKGITDINIKRRGDNFVQWAVQRVVHASGRRWIAGKRIWYGLA